MMQHQKTLNPLWESSPFVRVLKSQFEGTEDQFKGPVLVTFSRMFLVEIL